MRVRPFHIFEKDLLYAVIMSFLCLPSSFLFPSTCQQPLLSNGLRLNSNYLSQSFHSRCVCPVPFVRFSSKFHGSNIRHSFVCAATAPEEEGVVAVMNFDDLAEKDWSFLESDSDSTVSKEEYAKRTDQIISAGNVVATSKVLVSLGSDEFVDRLIDSSPCQLLLIVHESLLSLACIKERHDKVKCWQGELIFVPEKWAPLDVVFLYFLPGLPFTLEEIFKALAIRCSPGNLFVDEVNLCAKTFWVVLNIKFKT